MELSDCEVGKTVWLATSRQWIQSDGCKGTWKPIAPTLCKGVITRVDVSKYQPEIWVDWDKKVINIVPPFAHPSQLYSTWRGALLWLQYDIKRALRNQVEAYGFSASGLNI